MSTNAFRGQKRRKRVGVGESVEVDSEEQGNGSVARLCGLYSASALRYLKLVYVRWQEPFVRGVVQPRN